MKPHELPAWLKNLPPEVDELRIQAGASKAGLQSVGSLSVKPTTIGTAAAEIESLVDAAELGAAFRIFAFVGSKVVRTGMFSPAAADTDGSRSAQEAMLAAGPVASLEDALWRVSVSQASLIDRILASNERLVSGLALPLHELGALFNAETARRQNAEDRATELQADNMELGQLGRAMGDRIDQLAEGGADDGGKNQAIMDLVEALTGAFKGRPQQPQEPPKG